MLKNYVKNILKLILKLNLKIQILTYGLIRTDGIGYLTPYGFSRKNPPRAFSHSN